jgi:hypothetical protein
VFARMCGQVVQAFQQVQAALVKANPALKPTCIDPASAHITLFVLTLDGTKLQQALDVMQQLQQQPPASQPQQHLAHQHQEDSQQEAEEGVQDDHLHSSSSGAVPSPRQQACEPTPQPPSIQEPAMFGSRQGGSEPISSTPKRTCADDKQHTAEPAKPAGPQGHPEVWVQACQEVTLEAPWSSFEMDLRGLGHFNDKVGACFMAQEAACVWELLEGCLGMTRVISLRSSMQCPVALSIPRVQVAAGAGAQLSVCWRCCQVYTVSSCYTTQLQRQQYTYMLHLPRSWLPPLACFVPVETRCCVLCRCCSCRWRPAMASPSFTA